MPDDHLRAADVPQHRRGDLAGERATGLRAHVLGADRDRGPAQAPRDLGEVHERREHDDVDRPFRL
jgi:hypothetical protein